MCDTEFTIEQGKLWMLQTRVGKRTGAAALRMAVEMTKGRRSGRSPSEERSCGSPRTTSSRCCTRSSTPRPTSSSPKGLAASPGAAVGRAYFTADDAADAAERGEKVILVRSETSPEDVHGMIVAEGILTARGGLVSHAAVVARGWGKPAVVGAEAIRIDPGSLRVGDVVVHEGDVISISRLDGRRLGEIPVKAAEASAHLATILGWADDVRKGELGVRANADNGPDASQRPPVRRRGHRPVPHRAHVPRRGPPAHRPAHDPGRHRARRPPPSRSCAAPRRPTSRRSSRRWTACPVTVRLLDPPLHEFLPSTEELGDQGGHHPASPTRSAELYDAAKSWHEFNPMLGTRGVRLGVIKPGLYAMQVRALMEAAAERVKKGGNPIIEIMIPLTITQPELTLARQWCEDAIAPRQKASKKPLEVTIGTMIETPRACLRADDIALEADFFSFGTNDLTQMTLGFSRDDVEGRMMEPPTSSTGC